VTPHLAAGPKVVPGLRAVAEAFAGAGYRPEGIAALLGVERDIPTTRADLSLHRRRLAAAPGPLADLVGLFAFGWPVAIDRAVAALGSAGVDALVASGGLVERDGAAHPLVRIAPHDDVWIASDRPVEDESDDDPQHVPGINPPATLLAALTVRHPVGSALDLGTGNGIQALLLSRHCDRVVATDSNPRALAFAAFNAALNDIATIELRAGSWFEPVAGERFDLIVSNPPYVISPEHEYMYRDSGQEPGAVCATVIGGLPAHLTDRGYGSVLASWPVYVDRHWSEQPRRWMTRGGRAWLLQFSLDDPLSHAARWNQPLALAGQLDAFDSSVGRWLDYTGARGIEAIGYGAVVLQQHDGEAIALRADHVRAGHGDITAQVERVFAAYDLVAGLDDDAFAGSTWQPAPELLVRRGLRHISGDWQPAETVVTLADGALVEATLDPMMGEILLRSTSGLSVRAAAEQVASLAGLDPDQLPGLVTAAVAMVRELVTLGALVATG